MRKLTLILLTCFSISALAQEKPVSKREFGLRGAGLNNFGLIYKKPTDKGNYWRFHLASLQYQYQDNSNTTFNSSVGAVAFGIGYEYRKAINSEFQFIHGPEPRISASFSNSRSNLGLGLAYILGAQYQLSQSFYIGLELSPSLNFNISDVGGADQTALSLNANSNVAFLFIVYRF